MTDREQNTRDEYPDLYCLEGRKTGTTSVVRAFGFRQDNGILVLAGSIAASEELPSLQNVPGYAQQRQELIEASVLETNPTGGLLLNVHRFFRSPSAASCVMFGASSNGRVDWRRLVDDRSIKELDDSDGEESATATLSELAQALERLTPEQLGEVSQLIHTFDDDTESATDH